MPFRVDEAELLEGLKTIVDIERDWIPEGEGQSFCIIDLLQQKGHLALVHHISINY